MKALMLIAVLLSSTAYATPWNVINYEITVLQQLDMKAHIEWQLGDQVQDTINRYYEEHYYLYLDGDKLTFEITPFAGEVWKMWGCVIDRKLIITANNPLTCI